MLISTNKLGLILTATIGKNDINIYAFIII